MPNFRIIRPFVFNVGLLGCLLGGAAPAGLAQTSLADKDTATKQFAGDTAWTQLSTKSKPSRDSSAEVNWSAVATEAADFQAKYPDHAQTRTAGKIKLLATLHLEDSQPEISKTTATAVEVYLADKANPVRDRVELKIGYAQAGLRRTKFTSEAERNLAHVAHANELIGQFPDQPEGYGYKLSLAKGQSGQAARSLAESLVGSKATPPAFKTGAQRVLARLDLEGKKLTVAGAEAALASALGNTVVVYTWAAKDTGFLERIARLARWGDVRFVGVNLDADAVAAKRTAESLKLPGLLLYDGGGLDGPVARQLQLTMTASLYIADEKGTLRFVDGHRNTEAKLTQLAVEKGFKP